MMRRSALIAFAIVLASSLAFAQSNDRVDRILDSLFRLHTFSEVAISPDGTRVAWVERANEQESNETTFIADLATRKAKQLTAAKGATRERGGVWSHDGKQFAFLANEGAQAQIRVASISTAGIATRVRRITNVKGSIDNLSWSPDDAAIAFLFVENAVAPRPTEPMLPRHGVVGAKIDERRLATVAVSGGEVKTISPADMYVYEYDWSADGRTFAIVAAKGEGNSRWWVANLHTLDRASGALTTLFDPPLQIAVPRFSPDGKEIAFIHGLMSDQGVNGGEIWSIPASGGALRNLTPGLRGSVRSLQWLPDRSILFTEIVDGRYAVATLAPSTEQPKVLWSGDENLSQFSSTLDGSRSALTRSSAEHPAEVWAGGTGSWQQVTASNSSVQPAWGAMSNVVWTNEGMRVQGWLLAPRDVDPAKKYPMIVYVHGGPSSASTAGWPFDYNAALASAGYFVFLANPRGSFGQGESFTLANVRDFGYGDLRDILAGVEEVKRIAPIDPKRVGIWGWSYGGFMTMWAVTQSGAFRAAVAGAGISNWQSYYGQNDISEWMVPFFGASVYDDPYIYARSAPINFVKNVKTPTLLVVGDRDAECPAPQSFEFFRALDTLGVDTQLVVYPDEGHSISKPEDRRDIARRLVGWFDSHM